MRNCRYRRESIVAISRRGWEKRQICHPLEIVLRLYSKAGFWRTNLRAELPKLAPDKAFRNPARAGEEIQGSQWNHGLYSIHAIAISWLNNPATTLFSGAIFLLVSRLDSLGRPSQRKTVMRTTKNDVFAYTQPKRRFTLRNTPMYGMTVQKFYRREEFLEKMEF